MDKRCVEVIIACNALSWGLWLLFGMSHAQFARDTFSGMAHVAPPEVWAIFFIGGGTILLLSAVMNWQFYRRIALAAGALTWFATWVAFVLANWRSAATVTYFWFFVLCVYAYLRAGKDGTAGRG